MRVGSQPHIWGLSLYMGISFFAYWCFLNLHHFTIGKYKSFLIITFDVKKIVLTF